MKFSLGSAKHHGDSHKQTAWRARGHGRIFDGLNHKFSPNTIRYSTATELAVIKKFMPCGRILDLGCGTGRLLVPLIDSKEHEAFGLDISFPMLEAMVQTARAADLSPRAVNASASTNLPFGDAVFDGVLSFGMISHYRDWMSVLRLIVPHLKETAPLLFDMSVWHPEKDRFAAATNPALGGFQPHELGAMLAEVGLRLERVVPQRFGGSMDITADWLPSKFMTVEAFGQLHILIERFVESLLAEPACCDLALNLDELLRDILAFRSKPIYRPGAPVLVIARRDAAVVNDKDQPSNLTLHTQASATDALLHAFGTEKFAGAGECSAFMSYLALLDPLLKKLDGGRGVALEVFGDAYVAQLQFVQSHIGHLANAKHERALRANFFKTYRRFYRRLISLRQRLV